MSKRFINLLPPEEQRENHLEHTNSQVVHFGVWLVLSLMVMFLVLLVSRVIFVNTLKETKNQVAAATEEFAKLEQTSLQKEINVLNQDITSFKILNEQNQTWSPYLTEFARLLPADVTVDSMTLSRADRKVEVTGHAGTRRSVLELRENILNSDYFENINFPLANLEAPTNLNWKYRFYLSEKKGQD